ncbi:hypothetical protein AAZV13_08G243500 [Glycine max]
MAWSLTLPPPPSLSSSSLPTFHHHPSVFCTGVAFTRLRHRRTSNTIFLVPSVGKEDTDLRVSSLQEQQLDDGDDDNDEEPTPQDLEYVAQIKRVLELLRKNRDMIFGEINEGKIPKDRAALQMLAEELASWPNLEDALPKKKPSKSLYAKATDTGIDPELAAKKLNIDWDSAAEIEEQNADDETEVPPVVGYGALYLVSAFPIIIGISVVLILFYNSLQ